MKPQGVGLSRLRREERLGWSAAVAAAALLTLSGCPAPDNPGDSNVVDVIIQNLTFQPKEVQIRKGQIVRWTNADGMDHTATSGDPAAANVGILWDSGTLSAGQSFTRQFLDVGEFEYFCAFHVQVASMRHAKVIVLDP